MLSAEIKDYNVMIDGQYFLDKPIKSNMRTYNNILKMIAMDLGKKQALDADSRATQQINFTANIDQAGNTIMLFVLEEAKEATLDFSYGTARVL